VIQIRKSTGTRTAGSGRSPRGPDGSRRPALPGDAGRQPHRPADGTPRARRLRRGHRPHPPHRLRHPLRRHRRPVHGCGRPRATGDVGLHLGRPAGSSSSGWVSPPRYRAAASAGPRPGSATVPSPWPHQAGPRLSQLTFPPPQDTARRRL